MYSDLHTPVLFSEVSAIFGEQKYKNPIIIDATLGLGGHANMLISLSDGGVFVGFDRDAENLDRASRFIGQSALSHENHFVHSSFSHMKTELAILGIDTVDTILYDLGVSSVHFDDGMRGFSLRFDGPLDMRFDRTVGKTATDLIMSLDAPELARIFSLYGEEKKSWFIAQAILKERKETKIDTTQKLLTLIETSSFDKKSPLRVFQALRIAVNEEFSHIEDSLHQALSLLNPGGIIMVITFHSLEDRLVKHIFAPYLDDIIDETTGQIREKAKYIKYTKKPIVPTEEEISLNPRSRSAKLRIIQRI